jgi:hypothetical protein
MATWNVGRFTWSIPKGFPYKRTKTIAMLRSVSAEDLLLLG